MAPTTTTTNPKKKTETVKCVVLGAADAGKTSLLRRYFRETFDLGRVPTVGSDFYTKRVVIKDVNVADTNDNAVQQVPVLLQMFDTPGEVQDRRRRPEDEEEQQRHMDALLHAFVGRVDGVMLVYDMTSSTSFGQLRQWHAQWRKHARSDQPILIVGNKRDLIPTTPIPIALATPTNGSSSEAAAAAAAHQHAVPQRDVMGVQGSFKGNDFRYEYRVDHHQGLSSNSAANSTSGMTTPPSTTFYSNHNSANSLTKHSNSTATHSTKHRNHHQISTFSATTDAGILWTQDQDGTYLDSLLTTEDNSNPDRDMVKLWCMRNGLQHVEVSCSAPPPRGDVTTAMETLVQLILETRRQKQQQQQQQMEEPNGTHTSHSNSNGEEKATETPSNGSSNNQSTTTAAATTDPGIHYGGPNKTLDLLERYRPKNDKCCFCFPRLLPKNKARFV